MAKKGNQIEKQQKWYEQNESFLKHTKKKFSMLGTTIIARIILLPFTILMFLLIFLPSLFSKSSIKAAEFDARVNAKCDEAKKRVFATLGIDQSQVKEAAPIITRSYLKSDLMRIDQKTGKVWSNLYRVSIVLFGAEEVFCYTYTFCMTQESMFEETDEYFYSDIVSIKQSKQRVTYVKEPSDVEKKLATRKKTSYSSDIYQYNAFTIQSSSGDSKEFAYSGANNIESINKSINGMKQLIREKKAV